jgi:hypothetical protein
MRVKFAMDVIVSELRAVGVDIHTDTLTYYINDILHRHGPTYDEMAAGVNPREFRGVFENMNVVNFGRAMAYLALVYIVNAPEELKREAVRLVAEPLKSFDGNTWWARDRWFYMVLKRIYA